MEKIINFVTTGVKDECGICGVYSDADDALVTDIYYGLYALQHRGQESAGVAVIKDKKIHYFKNIGLVSEVFNTAEVTSLPHCKIAIGHVRYASATSINVANAQPLVFKGRLGDVAVAYNGNITNFEALREELIKEGIIFQTAVDVEIIATLINKYTTNDISEGVLAACNMLQGAFSIVVMCNNTLIAVRDKHGFRPLILGKNNNKYIIASESCAFDVLEAEIIRDVKAGEVLIINNEGINSFFLNNIDPKFCIFEYVYIARSDSIIDCRSVYEARHACGRYLAELYKVDADIVSGVPDSALAAAKGYSDFSGIPFVDALAKNRYVGRTFIQPQQKIRENSVRVKLTAFNTNIKGKRVILVDDSIVRGTTCKSIVSMLRKGGAREVHMMIASPPVMFPCYYGIDMQTSEQLIGAQKSIEEIRQMIGADSLHYLPLEYLKKACAGNNGASRNSFCSACFDGKYCSK